MATATREQQNRGMTAIRMYEHGGPEVLKVEMHPIPTPEANEVLIRVQAASVSWFD